jgi:hypothetical protein
MSTPSQQVITVSLNANGGSRWKELYGRRAAGVLAAAARPMLTVVPSTLLANWVNLDSASLAASPSVLEVAQDLADDTRSLMAPPPEPKRGKIGFGREHEA